MQRRDNDSPAKEKNNSGFSRHKDYQSDSPVHQMGRGKTVEEDTIGHSEPEEKERIIEQNIKLKEQIF